MGRFIVGALIFLAAQAALADTVTIPANRDNTLFSESGTLSDGAGQYLFADLTGGAAIRRSLIRFDITPALPPRSTINAVTLTLYMSKTISGPDDISLYRLTANWGEGSSDASGEEGGGTNATAGDATWTRRFYPTQPWATPGGDAVSTASATASVADVGFYSWSSSTMATDAQAWFNDPNNNFGWLIRGPELIIGSAKRFDSRQGTTPSQRPALQIVYTPLPGDLDHNGTVDLADIAIMISAYGTCIGDPSYNPVADLDHSGCIDLSDLASELGDYGH